MSTGNENVTEFPGQYIPEDGENLAHSADEVETMSPAELGKALGGAEIVLRSEKLIDDDQLLHVEDLTELYALLESTGVKVDKAEEVLGDGFALVSGDDKMRLIGKPLLFVQWQFMDSKFGPLVSVQCYEITGPGPKDFRKWKIIDTSAKSGLYRDLLTYSDTYDKFNGLFLKNGLRVSQYTIEIDGKPTAASTYYLDYSV